MSGLWLPPEARTFAPDVESVLADSPPEARRLAALLEDQGVSFATDETTFGATVGPDSGLILLPREWGRMKLEDGRHVLAAFVESKPLERMIMDGRVDYVNAGVVETAEHPMVQATCPALWLQLKQFNVFVPLEYDRLPCPVDWRLDAPRGFAIAVPHPDPTEARSLYIGTPQLVATPPGFVLPQSRGSKVGRNDRCPCGSGVKFKRCCGGSA